MTIRNKVFSRITLSAVAAAAIVLLAGCVEAPRDAFTRHRRLTNRIPTCTRTRSTISLRINRSVIVTSAIVGREAIGFRPEWA